MSLTGDFNCCLSPLDIENGTGFNQKFCSSLNKLFVGKRMLDAYRFKYPGGRNFTFHQPGRTSSRLDRLCLSSHLAEAISISHIPSLSDHCAVLHKVKLPINRIRDAQGRNQTYWKLNNAILCEEEFLPAFKLLSDKLLRYNVSYPSISDWWDKVAKPQIRDFCIAFSKHRRAARTDTIKFLLSYLKICFEDLN